MKIKLRVYKALSVAWQINVLYFYSKYFGCQSTITVVCWSRSHEKFPLVLKGSISITVKFLNFRTPKNFAVICLKFKQRGQTLRVFCQKDVNGKANSEDPDQTAPLGEV